MSKPTFLILGTNHMDTANNVDMFGVETDDVLSAKRQQEIQEVVDKLIQFKPTKIALEVPKENQSRLTKEYSDYLGGTYQLTRNEIDQIGFRLGETVGHKNICAVDWNEDEGLPDLEKWGAENPSTIFDGIMERGHQMAAKYENYFKNHSIRDFLIMLNDPESVERDHEIYMQMALIGDEQNHVGAMWTAKYWYYRNMIIYKNLLDLVHAPDERIFVLYGAGHVHLLTQFLGENGDFQIDVPSNYL